MTSLDRRVGTQRAGVASRTTPLTSADGGSRSSRCRCAVPRNLPVGVACGGPHDEDLRGDGRARARDCGPGRAPRPRWRRAAGSPARRSSCRRRCSRRRSSAGAPARPPRAPSAASSRSLVGGGHLAEQVGRVVVVHRLEDVGGSLVLERAQHLDLVVLLHLLRARRPAARRRGRATTSMRRLSGMSCRACATSAGRRSDSVDSSASVPWSASGSASPSTSFHSTWSSCPRAAGQPAAAGAHREPREHPVARCGSAPCRASTTVDRAARSRAASPCGRAARRVPGSRSARRSKRFMLTVPDDSTTWSASMRVTRPIGTKIRCRCCNSTTRPRIRGGWRSTRSVGDRVAHPSELVAARVEHADAGQPRDEHARRRAHQRLPFTSRMQVSRRTRYPVISWTLRVSRLSINEPATACDATDSGFAVRAALGMLEP